MVTTEEYLRSGVTDDEVAGVPTDGNGTAIVNPMLRRPGDTRDRGSAWLRNAMISLGFLAAASAVVSFTAQYRLVFAAKHVRVIAGLEAAIPDVAALIFASLGIALALHGKRAIRARVLNVGAVGTSITMNVLAAGHGWRDLAIWAMPPIAYALASDTAIGVVRAWAIARQKALNEALADDESTPLAIVGGFLLWMLRLLIAPVSTLGGFRRWVLDECPVAPGRRVPLPVPAAQDDTSALAASRTARAITAPRSRADTSSGPRDGTKTARFIALVAEHHGPLADFPVTDVSRVCTALAPEIGLDAGAARAALRKHILALQGAYRNGNSA